MAPQVAIDVIKHAVISKFNDMRPGLYRELFKDVCERARTGNSHSAHRVVAFEPYAPAAFAVRIVLTAAGTLRGHTTAGPVRWAAWAATAAVPAWLTLFAAKAGLGYGLRVSAAAYLRHYEQTHAQKGRGPVRPPAAKSDVKKNE
jgi:hypothetical protein